MEQDLIVIVSSPPLPVPLRPGCPPQIVYSPAFLPVSAQSWEQMMQIIHLLKMGLKTSTTGSFAVCVLAALAGQTLSLALPLYKKEQLQPPETCQCVVQPWCPF